MNENKLKPFDLEKAKQGAEVVTRDGKPARIICWDRVGKLYPIVALVECHYNDGKTEEEVMIYTNQGTYNDDGGEPPYDGKQWLDLSCTEYEIPSDKFKDGDNVEIIIRKVQKGE